MEREKFLSAVYIVIIKDNKVLLQRRQGTKLWFGFLALPAGHIDVGENAYEALFREAKEELDITLSQDSIFDTFVVNRKNNGDFLPYYDVYFVIDSYGGEIKINEVEKCSELKWVDINNLPPDMIDYEISALKNWQNNIRFSTYNETKVEIIN